MEQLILDTETTGLDDKAEVIEIAIIGAFTGKVYLDTLVKPKSPIPAEATAIHGISNDDVKDAPTWPELYQTVLEILNYQTVNIYNSQYDVRIIEQTCALYQLQPPVYTSLCVMLEYAEFYEMPSPRGGYKWQSLSNAAKQQGIDISDLTAHRAVSDCEITSRLMQVIESNNVKRYGAA